jgi:hypothetical protein
MSFIRLYFFIHLSAQDCEVFLMFCLFLDGQSANGLIHDHLVCFKCDKMKVVGLEVY